MNRLHQWHIPPHHIRNRSHAKTALIALIISIILTAVTYGTALTSSAYAQEEIAPASEVLSWNELKTTLDTYVGNVPYVWGAKDYDAWDCSGFVGRMLVDKYNLPIPGGSWENCGCYAIEELLQEHYVTGGTSVEEFDQHVTDQTIKPGDIILFSQGANRFVHVGIVGEQGLIYHAMNEERGTVCCSLHEFWGGETHHNKLFDHYHIYRGLGSHNVALRLQKVSAAPSITNNNPNYTLEGATYTIYDSEHQQVTTLTCNAQGTTDMSHPLPEGIYFYQETSAPNGYQLDGEAHQFELSLAHADEHGIVTINTSPEVMQTRADIQIAKIDAETDLPQAQGSASLAGAIFELKYYPLPVHSVQEVHELDGVQPLHTWHVTTDEQGKAQIDSWVSDEGVVVDGLPLGIVCVQEIQAPHGYLLNDTPQLIHIDSKPLDERENLHHGTRIKQQVMRGDLKLIKHAQLAEGDEQALEGVPFSITSVTTGETHTLYTDAQGILSTHSSHRPHTQHTNEGTIDAGVWFGGGQPHDSKGALPYDSYIVEEIKNDANHHLMLADPIHITIDQNNATIELDPIVNHERPHALISKTDITQSAEIPGATLSIYSETGELIEQWISGDKPHKVYLEPGTYRLCEQSAPRGYLLANDITFEVTEERQVTPVAMVDEATRVEINKIDCDTGRPLAGASFELIDEEGVAVCSWISEDEPYQITALPAGTYTLRELSAPAGYAAMEDMTITIEETSEIQRIVVANARISTLLPQTQDCSWWSALLMVGIAITISGMGVLFGAARKKHQT